MTSCDTCHVNRGGAPGADAQRDSFLPSAGVQGHMPPHVRDKTRADDIFLGGDRGRDAGDPPARPALHRSIRVSRSRHRAPGSGGGL
jgi:hypothetical protein